MLPDTHPLQFVIKKIPESWRPYIRLIRLDRPIGIWLLLFPCWWAVVLASDGIVNMPAEAWKDMAKFAVGAILMRSAGCIINDLWDRQLDASVERTKSRPLATGEIGVINAQKFLIVLLVLSLALLLTFSLRTIGLGILSLPLVAIYPKMKRITWLPQLFLGFTFSWGALLGWVATTGHLGSEAFQLYAGGVLWTLGYDTIYAHQDKNDDALVGIKSTARLFGNKSRVFVTLSYVASLIFLIVARYNSASPSILTPLLASFPLAQVVWQMKTWDINDPESCLRVFKSNTLYGWLVLLLMAI
ncbi:MAG: 4-hydroxybenzoate octaprenyltransferase [Proteobacteria bacterium]|nr:4-hydroxybenzoate octaprenyltransferase [Pseudomonadota bacterium]